MSEVKPVIADVRVEFEGSEEMGFESFDKPRL